MVYTRFEPQPVPPSATEALQLALHRRDECGMYWADTIDFETALASKRLPSDFLSLPWSPTPPPRRPTLSHHRAFISPSASSPPSSPRNPRILMILPSPIIDVLYFSPAGVDPLLLALERESRIGVRTQCARCRVHGRSFPSCSRTADSYCSRECRVEMKDTRG